MMTVHYQKIMELWQAGKFFEAISYSNWLMSENLLNEEEIGNFSKNLSKFWELVEVECEENVEVMFNLYKMLKKARKWDDETLCKKLTISKKAIEEIKSHHNPRSEGLGLRMLYELFPQMAV